MNPGTLDRKIFIQRQAPGLPLVDTAGNYLTTPAGDRLTTNSRRGRFGAEQDAWGLLTIRWANKKDLRGDESTKSGRKIAHGDVRFRVRYVAGLKRTDRVQFDGMAFDIVDVQEIERRKLHDIYCVFHSNLTAEGQSAE